ncbi:hypothetical protein AAMO2058_001593500 [Amorphochlora amoebiformis]
MRNDWNAVCDTFTGTGGKTVGTLASTLSCLLKSSSRLEVLKNNNAKIAQAITDLGKEGADISKVLSSIEETVDNFNSSMWYGRGVDISKHVDKMSSEVNDVQGIMKNLKNIQNSNANAINNIQTAVNSFGCLLTALNIYMIYDNLKLCRTSSSEIKSIQERLDRMALSLEKLIREFLPNIKTDRQRLRLTQKMTIIKSELDNIDQRLDSIRKDNVKSGTNSLLVGFGTMLTTFLLPFTSLASFTTSIAGGVNALTSLWNYKTVCDVSKVKPLLKECYAKTITMMIEMQIGTEDDIPLFDL